MPIVSVTVITPATGVIPATEVMVSAPPIPKSLASKLPVAVSVFCADKVPGYCIPVIALMPDSKTVFTSATKVVVGVVLTVSVVLEVSPSESVNV